MDTKKKKTVILCLKILKYVILPCSRLRKLSRKSGMKQYKMSIFFIGVSSCFITLLLYYWHRTSTVRYLRKAVETTPKGIISSTKYSLQGTPMRHMPLNKIYGELKKEDEYSFEMEDNRIVRMLDTPGCQIPLHMIDYKKYMKKIKNPATCGRRAVFLKKVDEDKIEAYIKIKPMKTYLRRSLVFDCCARFIKRAKRLGMGNKLIKFTSCQKFEDGGTITLESDFVNVRCFEYDKRNISRLIYDDIYPFVKKITKPNDTNGTKCKDKYNVLMIGIDSMSLPRISKTMERTIHFFHDNYWAGYRGYHKIGDNTFPNLMATLTGLNLSELNEKCSGRMDHCNDLIIWSKFRDAGYVTAYGEDYLRLPDTFTKKYAFLKTPTDHYMRTFFLKGETEMNDSLVCAGKVPSAQQVLDYALDFAVSYRRDSFFGVFWLNSFSHNDKSRPQDADKIVDNFLNQLSYTGVLHNTFVIFFSDHGVRFGEHRFKMESYYDDRMPMFFIWTPSLFTARHPLKLRALAYNQWRLITPYDIYNTLFELNSLSNCSNMTTDVNVSRGCPKCQSIFDVVTRNRTCQDASISPKWCSCHKLFGLDLEDTDGRQTAITAVSYIKNITKSIKTKRCWGCMSLSLKDVIRIHYYYDKEKVNLYHVIAFTMAPGNISYEATFLRQGSKAQIVGPMSVISPYRGTGKCVINPVERLFCACQKIQNCQTS